MSNFKEFEEYVHVHGKLLTVNISITVEEDPYIDIRGDFDFGDPIENEKYLNRFKSGELFMGMITVTAFALGETGADHLGACHLISNNYFNSEPFDTSVNDTVNTYDMINNAIDDLLKNLDEKAATLQKYYG